MILITLKCITATILALAGSGATYQYVATKLDKQRFPPIGKMIDVDGYKLHMIDSGTGGPTVVMDAGLGGYCLDWSLVQPKIVKFTRVITYDRAGYGWSDESPRERTSENAMKELHAMLHNASVPAPYVLVGQSLGGVNVRLFAMMYPDEVAGIVLVDSSHELQIEKLPKINHPVYFKPAVAVMLSKLGIVRRFTSYFINTDNFAKYSSIQKMYNSQKLTTKFVRTMTYEFSNFEQSLDQLKKTGGHLGDKPLTVLTAGKQANKVWPTLQADLVTKSTQGKQIIVKASGHMIHHDQPETVVDAIREMIDALKSRDDISACPHHN